MQQRILALRQLPPQQGLHVLGLRGAERKEGSKGALHVIREGCDNSYRVITTLSLLLDLLALSQRLHKKGFLWKLRLDVQK